MSERSLPFSVKQWCLYLRSPQTFCKGSRVTEGEVDHYSDQREFAEIQSDQGQDKLGLFHCGRADRLRLPMCPLGPPPMLSLGSLQAALRWAARPLGPEGNKNPQSQC